MIKGTIPLREYSDEEIRFHKSEVFRLSREEAAEELLVGALNTLNQEHVPSAEIRFRPRDASRRRSWPKASFVDAHQAYVDGLQSFDGIARRARGPQHLADLTGALFALIETANKIALEGWDVNWRQNVQWALRGSRYGLSDYSLVERYENLPDRTTLSERLETIGGPIFYKQKRKREKLGKITPVLFGGEVERAYGAVILSLNTGVGRRYWSDWIVDERGGCSRLLSD
ncbi:MULTISPECIES: hypothetical protein [unclassified Ensifer]|uniref:hypothetical protein n=1 Tax=unclassified Ensifer TaxID=2633371 RepID=UPI000713D50E|nr:MULTISPECIES: hypothetical protein [unclassified Ensifer]KQX43241.1 hypothetical protein ASD49_11330 [Ensifer sp. Root1298]KQX72789.1 hypothetical protein ASD41_11830 [Ensifer sp. Root1312]KRC15755.1 hypothetical protein ASE29_11385 [Ensifer sp. Root74]KRD59030.1 hypothetical protein ASE71_09460 [Ensifer sp. Root954]